MHVLADTFAHQTFAGVPLGVINEVRGVKFSESGSDLKKKIYFPGNYSPTLSGRSFGYLGHGRIGHLPDYPGVFFKYTVEWANDGGNTPFSRNNPLEFYCAYVQMREALKYILNKGKGFHKKINRGNLCQRAESKLSDAHKMIEAFEKSPTDKELISCHHCDLRINRTGRQSIPAGQQVHSGHRGRLRLCAGHHRPAFHKRVSGGQSALRRRHRHCLRAGLHRCPSGIHAVERG